MCNGVNFSAHHKQISPIVTPAIRFPFGENANAVVVSGLFIGNIAISLPSSTSHSRFVLSLDPLTSSLPSGENANDWM